MAGTLYSKEELRKRNLSKTDWHDMAKQVIMNSKYSFNVNMAYDVTQDDIEQGRVSGHAYTDGQEIFVAPMVHWFDNYIIHKAIVSALIVHESAHIAYSNMPSEYVLKDWYNKNDIKLPFGLTFQLNNVFEDGRIEAIVSERRDVWKNQLKSMNNYLFLKDFEEMCKKDEANNNDFLGFFNILLSFVKLRLNVTPHTTKHLSNPTLVKNLEEVMALYYKEFITANSWNAWDKLAILIHKIQDLYPEQKLSEAEVSKMLGTPGEAEAAASEAGTELGKEAAHGSSSATAGAGGEDELDDDTDGSSAAAEAASEKDKDEAKNEQDENRNLKARKSPHKGFKVNIASVNGMRSVLSKNQINLANNTAKDIRKLEVSAINKIENKKGKFKVKKYIKTAKQSPVVFESKRTSIKSELYMSLLIDHSGSMHGSKMEQAKSAAAILEETFKILKSDDFKIEIAAFTYFSGPEHTIIKSFGEDLPLGRSLVLASGLDAEAGNGDSYNIDYAVQGLRSVDKNKILVVLSDGQPAECSNDDVRKAVLKAKREGVTVLPVFFGHFNSDMEKEYQHMYDTGNNPILNAQNETELFNIFGSIVTRYMNN